MPTVSVIIPVYNNESTLRDCLDSVLAQTLPGIELVCVDDGSTDGSGAMLDECAAARANVMVLHQANSGSGPARNAAINHASGEFVAFMDADDRYCDERALETLYETAQQQRVDIVGGQAYILADGAANTKASTPSPFFKDKDIWSMFKPGRNEYANSAVMYGYWRFLYRRELLIAHGIYFPDYRRYQDPPFMVRAMATAKVVYVLDTPVYMYRASQNPKQQETSAQAVVCMWSGRLDVLAAAKKHGLFFMLRHMPEQFCDPRDLCRAQTYRYLIEGNTDVEEVWRKVVQTAKDEGFYDERFFPTDFDEMRAQISRYAISRRRVEAKYLWRRGERRQALLRYAAYLKGKLFKR